MRKEIRILKTKREDGSHLYYPVTVTLDDKGSITGYETYPVKFSATTKFKLLDEMNHFIQHAEIRPVVNEEKLCKHLKMDFYPMGASDDFTNDPLGELLNQLTQLSSGDKKIPVANDTMYSNEMYNPDILEMLEAISFYCDTIDDVYNNPTIKDKKLTATKAEKELITELRVLMKRFK